KLSKQTDAHDISLTPINETLINILRYLNLNPPPKLLTAKSTDILEWGIHAWSLERIQPKDSIIFQTD
ncbi:MAG: tRNA glutamyl-Q(34) synthetase GluQRS, partial [Cycloclasticus sp.]